MKHTPGKTEVLTNKFSKNPREIVTGVGVKKIAGMQGRYHEVICNMLLPETDEEYIKHHERIRADAELINEAFNIANETGFTPIQLADQNKKLRNILKWIERECDKPISIRSHKNYIRSEINKALKTPKP